MSFLSRATKAYDRGDKVRAVVTLIEGLKRAPDNADALDMLLRLYGVEVDGMGLEPDVIKILKLQPDADDLLSVFVDNARACGHDRVADALLELGEGAGLTYVPPSADAPVDEPEEPTQEPESADDEPDVVRDETASEPPATDDGPAQTQESPIPTDWLDDIDDLSERSVPEDEHAPADEEAREEPQPARRRRKSSRVVTESQDKGFSRRKLVIAGVLLVVAILGSYGYFEVKLVSAEARVEAALATVAPHRIDATRDELNDLEKAWRGSRSVQDRIAFTRSYISWVESESAEPAPLGESPWASGSLAIAAAQRGDLEEALEMVTRAERTDAAAVPSLIARAVVEEERQRWSSSDRAWANVSERDPDVVAAYEGRARNAWRRLDSRQLTDAIDALEKRDAKHPYLVLRTLAEPFGVVPRDTTVRTESDFLESLERFRRARAAFERDDFESAVEAAEELASREPSGIAALQHGVVLARAYAPDEATKAFERAALTEGTTRDLRLRIQAVAVEALVGIGRPDLSERFETTLPEKTPREKAELRLPALRRSAIESIRESDWAVRAVFAHVDAVAQRGDIAEAHALYEFLEGREVDPERARWESALLRLEGERNVRKSPVEGEAGAVWSAASDYLDGEYEKVNLLTGLPTEGRLGESARRYQILSLVASRRVAVALQLLEEERGKVAAEADGLKVRAFARQARSNARFKTLFEKMVAAKPVGIERQSDLAAAAFWQGRVDEATSFADAVLAMQPDHRQANWIKGLILRQQGEFGDADAFLRKSGRDWDDTAGLLIELGYVSLALENWDEARKSFYKAFLKNRENIESVRGLGMAYAAIRSEVAVRDLARIESGLPNNPKFSPVRGEVLRWLAVVEGVREGNEAALGYLEGAMKEVGRRPDLLVEMARYHEARGERAEARKLYAAALQGNTTLASAHLGLARTALKDGDESVARDHLQRYLEVEPRGSGADWARKRLASLKEDP